MTRWERKKPAADDKIWQFQGLEGHEARLTEEIINEGGKLVKSFLMKAKSNSGKKWQGAKG